MADIFARMQQIYATTSGWAANNIVLQSGEIGVEVVSASDVRMKVGDGVSTFAALPYAASSSSTINAPTQAALDAKLALAGGTMTGLLVLSGDPSAALGATTRQYVDNADTALSTSLSGKLNTTGGTLTGFLTLNADPASALHAAPKQYVDTGDALKVSKSGDTMTGALVLAADPANALEAATKGYVDSGPYQTTVGGSSAYAGKVPRLNASGVLDSSVVPPAASYLGTVNLTVAYALTGTFTAGNYYGISTSGTIEASWSSKLNGSPTPTTCGAGQFIYYNVNGKWDLVGEAVSAAAINGKLDKAGGTMTGLLVLSGDPSAALGAATKQFAENQASPKITGPASAVSGNVITFSGPSGKLAQDSGIPSAQLARRDQSNVFANDLEISASGTNSNFYLTSVGGTGRKYLIASNSNGTLSFYDSTAAAGRMTLDASGNFGIGTAPGAKLDVAGYSRFGNYGGVFQGFLVQNNNDSSSAETASFISAANNLGTFDSHLHLLHQTDGGARIEIGTTPPGSRSTDRRAFRGSFNANGHFLWGTASENIYDGVSGAGTVIYGGGSIAIAAPSTNAATFRRLSSNGAVVVFGRDGNNVGSISVTNTATSYNTSSDYRLKDSVIPMTGALAKIMQLKPVSYTWKVDGSYGQGFLAHELQVVFPDAVTGAKDAVDSDNKPIYQGVDHSKLIVALVAAFQQMKTEFDAYVAAHP